MRFEDFARANGLILDHAIRDGRWHRVPTEDHPRKRNGAYVYDERGGALQNWATMQEVAVWRPDRPTGPVMRAAVRLAKVDEEARHQRARDEAKRLLGECERLRHPYLASKGFPTALGLVHPSGELLIPMRERTSYDTVVNGVQRIFPDGTKKFLPGTKAKGGIFRLGSGRETWLVEGYATGLSVLEATADLRRKVGVIVCFSAGNLAHVAQYVRPPAFVFADHDASETGERAAMDTGLPWTMTPEFGDANDYHQAHGLRALVKFMLEMT